MTKNVNNIKPKKKKKEKTTKKPNSLIKHVHAILDGSFINSGNLTQKLLLTLFIASLGLIYIANSHFADKRIREITKLNSLNKEMSFNHQIMKTKLNEKKRASYLTEKLKSTGIKPSITPPEKIYTNP